MVSSAKWKRNYQYDSLGRLTLAQTTGPQWGQSFSYDGFGNLTAEVATKGTAPTVYNNYDPATNRLLGSGYTYDANGNLTAMPGLSMTYNVENRLTQAISNLNGTDNYGYDPAGHRVWKQGPDGVTHVYYNGLDGKPLADFSLNPQTQQVQGGSPMLYFAGKRVDNAAVEDRLGTAVVENGQQRMAFFPYGSQRSGTSSQVQYATYTRDATTTLDYAQQRYYSSQIGRYTTPDPKRSSAQAANPQSWNRYSYALGDPVNKTDPSGADPEFEDGEEMSPFGGMSSFGDAPTYLTMISVPEISIGIAVPGDSDDSDDYGGDPCYDASASIFNTFGAVFGLLGASSPGAMPMASSCGAGTRPPPPPPCPASYQSWIDAHGTDAWMAAQTLQTTEADVLGLSAKESFWGKGRFAGAGINDYFNLEKTMTKKVPNPSLFPLSTGWEKARESNQLVAKYANYLDSAESFALKYNAVLHGVTDPYSFASIAHQHGFGKAASYVGELVPIIQQFVVCLGPSGGA